jgi:septum formation protein
MPSYLLIAIAYIAGSIPVGLAIGKIFFGIDIREHGSGNIGASNVKRILGRKAGAAAFILDVIKGLLPVLAAKHWYPIHPWIQVLTGLAAIIGHNNSVFLKFTGGKGVATSCGVAIALSWPAALSGAGVWTIITYATGYISLGSILSAPVTGFLIWKLNHYSLPYGLFGLMVTLTVIYKHRSNIKRLIDGNELSIRDMSPRKVANSKSAEDAEKRLILASASPRRKELLATLGVSYEVIPSAVDETAWIETIGKVPPNELVQQLALEKATDVLRNNLGAVVIGADTIVVLDGEILGKPFDHDDAHRMLTKLSGKCHEVFTGIAVVTESYAGSDVVRTLVKFKDWTSDDIHAYIRTGEPLDKAGAYGIQNRDISPVESIEGDYYNVVGLPVEKLRALLLDHFSDLAPAPLQPEIDNK